MLRAWKFVLFFLLCLVVALLLNLPVQHLMPRVKLPQGVQVAGIDGTLLRGRAAAIAVRDFPLHDIEYRYRPSCLPVLKLCYDIDYAQGNMRVAYDTLNGDTEVSRTRIEYPAAELAAYMQNLPLRPDGRLELVVDEMSLIDGRPVQVSGKLIWRDLGVNDDGARFSIGDYQLDFTGDQREYRFKLNDLDASLDVRGDGTVRTGGEYQVDVRIESEDAIEPRVKSVLDLVAAKNGFNKYRIERLGRLPPQFAKQLFP